MLCNHYHHQFPKLSFLCPLEALIPHPLSSHWRPPSTFYLCGCDSSREPRGESQDLSFCMWLMSWRKCPRGSSMCTRCQDTLPFTWLSNIPSRAQTAFSFSMDMGVASTFQLVETYVYEYLKHSFGFFGCLPRRRIAES